jgi:hypothetical protein
MLQVMVLMLAAGWWVVDAYRWQVRQCEIVHEIERAGGNAYQAWLLGGEEFPWWLNDLSDSLLNLNAALKSDSLGKCIHRIGDWWPPSWIYYVESPRGGLLQLRLREGELAHVTEAYINICDLDLFSVSSLRKVWIRVGDAAAEDITRIAKLCNLEELVIGIRLSDRARDAARSALLSLSKLRDLWISTPYADGEIDADTLYDLANLPYLQSFELELDLRMLDTDKPAPDKDKYYKETFEQLKRVHPYMQYMNLMFRHY